MRSQSRPNRIVASLETSFSEQFSMIFMLQNKQSYRSHRLIRSSPQLFVCYASLSFEASHNPRHIPQDRQDISEMLWVRTRPELCGASRPLGQQFSLGQQTLELPRHSGAGIDQADVLRAHLL